MNYELVPKEEAIKQVCPLCHASVGQECKYDTGEAYKAIHLRRHATAFRARAAAPALPAVAKDYIANPDQCEGEPCWYNSETGYTEYCKKHEGIMADKAMDSPNWKPALPAVDRPDPEDSDGFHEVELRVCRKCSHQIEALVQMCPSGGLCSSDESIAPPDDEDAIIGQPIVWNLSFDVNKNEYTDEGQNYYVASEIGETIRQLTELLRGYRTADEDHDDCGDYRGYGGADFRCPLCIKADLLLKEPA